MKFIFLIEAKFNKRDYERYGISYFVDSGFEVEIWDLTEFLTNSSYLSTTPPDQIEFTNLFTFKHALEVQNSIRGLSDTSCHFVSMVHFNTKTIGLYRAISHSKIPYSIFISGGTFSRATKTKKNFFRRLNNVSLSKIYRMIFYRIPFSCFGIKPASFVIVPGERYNTSALPVHSSSKVIWVHSYDYEIYKRYKDVVLDEAKTIVFIDQYLPFHPDFEYIESKDKVEPELYFGQLNDFFDFVEQKLACKIIIAAHPRAHLSKMKEYYKNRPIYVGDTAKLIKTSSAAIIHNSYAVNYSVLFAKPLLFVTTEKINNLLEMGLLGQPFVNDLAEYFNQKEIILDQKYDHLQLDNMLNVDHERYNKFKNDYIKKEGSPEDYIWATFLKVAVKNKSLEKVNCE
ncbi:MAG: hypothetical protein JEZ03_01910 [Bacteroidales bacterium]|nr:hypothetical protein [Bacteroidales bacterium]